MLFEPTFEGSLYLQIGSSKMYFYCPVNRKNRKYNVVAGGEGRGVFPYEGLMGRAASQGIFFGIFVLNRVSILSFFALNRVSILSIFVLGPVQTPYFT